MHRNQRHTTILYPLQHFGNRYKLSEFTNLPTNLVHCIAVCWECVRMPCVKVMTTYCIWISVTCVVDYMFYYISSPQLLKIIIIIWIGFDISRMKFRHIDNSAPTSFMQYFLWEHDLPSQKASELGGNCTSRQSWRVQRIMERQFWLTNRSWMCCWWNHAWRLLLVVPVGRSAVDY